MSVERPWWTVWIWLKSCLPGHSPLTLVKASRGSLSSVMKFCPFSGVSIVSQVLLYCKWHRSLVLPGRIPRFFWGHTSTGFLRTLERKREFWHFQMISYRATEVTGGLIYGAFAHSIGVVFCRAFTTWSKHGQLAANDICTSQIKSARFCVFLHANLQWLKYDTSWRSRISWELKYNMCFI